VVNNWLALDESGGQVDRVVPAAGKEELTAFSHLVSNKSRKNFTDSHLWFSVFVRPTRSNFSRVQRLSVVVSLTFLTMLANAMFFRAEPPKSYQFEIGPLRFSSFELWVSSDVNSVHRLATRCE
jgi:polycystin 1L2